MKRKDFLEHVGWTGAGIAYAMTSSGIVRAAEMPDAPYFVQISDSHIGFHQAANPDVAATLQSVVDGINALPRQPKFVMHTGDVTHLAKAEQFDTAKHILGGLRAPLVALPGEHDVLGTAPAAFLAAFPPPSGSKGWFSWDADGIHYVGLVNVFDFESMGLLGNEQLTWLQRDLGALPASRAVVVFVHAPLYALYPAWGWTTADGAKALALLARFDAVTVLSGHIHQIIEHTEGNIRFATANATAYPQPAPGTADKPGPKVLPHDQLLRTIGYRTVELNAGTAAVRNVTLA
ncbi:MAG: metallophosphoesterase [Candidatus Eremiobacteraeota bacterium]|nr:metallophosphoesterase [Candidatus Eremiobacteraeota bacterium]MBV8373202.1 metallophosphoesterase [Candidatus Eremiobacteraeota bacterium]